MASLTGLAATVSQLGSLQSSSLVGGRLRAPTAGDDQQCSVRRTPACTRASSKEQESANAASGPSRREAIVLPAILSALSLPLSNLVVPQDAQAIIPTTAVAGRVPGLSEPDERGWRTYKRPLNKSGGHGVGWSELIPYSFAVPEGWEEVPVSIADLGGTEIDLRFQSKAMGGLSVVVAPVLRFSDTLGTDARVEKVGTPEKVISAFGPEITGESVEGKVKSSSVVQHDGLTYYLYELDPHILVNVTAAGNRLYILSVNSSGRQWKKYASDLNEILDSFRIG